MKKKWNDYKLYIFDMDGTLYFQRPLQLYMGFSMLLGCLRPGGLKELRLVLQFRKQREKWQCAESSDLDKVQYTQLGEKWHINSKIVEEIIQKWIYEKPLKILLRFRDRQLTEEVHRLKSLGKAVAIYSDYPATDKRKALLLPEIPCFYGGQEDIGVMKPDPKGIKVIMEYMKIENTDEILMVGDREDRDGQAAKNAGVDFLIVKKYRPGRKKQLDKLFAQSLA